MGGEASFQAGVNGTKSYSCSASGSCGAGMKSEREFVLSLEVLEMLAFHSEAIAGAGYRDSVGRLRRLGLQHGRRHNDRGVEENKTCVTVWLANQDVSQEVAAHTICFRNNFVSGC